jgi:rhamnulokinase
LTGAKVNEYTEASTGQLLNPKTKDWDYELIDMLGYNRKMFCEITKPGTKVGNFTKEVCLMASAFRL